MTEKLHFLVMLGPLMPKKGVGNQMPVRKVVRRSSVRTRGYFPSYKVGRPVAWESSLELRCIWFLEYSTAVKSYEEQPLVVDYIGADGKAAKTTPDFLVHLKRGGPLLIEVKPERKLKEKESVARFDCIADAAAAAGYHYLVVTESQLAREPIYSNLEQLVYARPPLYRREQLAPLAAQLNGKTLDFERVAQLLGGPKVAWQMLGLGLLQTNLRSAINESSILTIKETACDFLLG